MHRSPARTLALLACLILAAACRDGVGSDPGVPRAIAVLSPVALTGRVGEEASDTVVLRVEDGRGDPVPRQLVEFAVTAGDGWMFSRVGTSDENGIVRARWVLGTRADTPQAMEARLVAADGSTIAVRRFTATAHPGPAVELRVIGDTLRTVLEGDSTRIVLEGRDRFGNVIAELLDRTLTLSSASLRESASGYLVAMAGGDVTVTARAGTATARVRVTIPAPPLVLHFVDGPYLTHVVRAHGALRSIGIQVLSGIGERGVAYRLQDSTLVREAIFPSPARDLWSEGPTGPAWAVFGDSLYSTTSATTGGWVQRPGLPVGRARAVTGFAGTLYASTATTDERPYVYRRLGGQWVDLAFPQVRGDSVFQFVRIAAYAGGVLAVGTLRSATPPGLAVPSMSRLTDTTWTPVEMPPLPVGTVNASITTPVFAPDGSVAYAIRRALLPSFAIAAELLEVRGTRATIAAVELHAGYGPGSVTSTRDGRPLVVYPFGWAERRPDMQWKFRDIPSGWQTRGSSVPWVDADGTFWNPLTFNTMISRAGLLGVAAR